MAAVDIPVERTLAVVGKDNKQLLAAEGKRTEVEGSRTVVGTASVLERVERIRGCTAEAVLKLYKQNQIKPS